MSDRTRSILGKITWRDAVWSAGGMAMGLFAVRRTPMPPQTAWWELLVVVGYWGGNIWLMGVVARGLDRLWDKLDRMWAD